MNLLSLCQRLGVEGLVFFDLETSGLSPLVHEIIEIAAVKVMKDGQYSEFQTLAKPAKKLTTSNIEIHGITNEDLAEAPSLESGLQEFLEFAEGHALIAYNAQFDIGFLSVDLWKYQLAYKNNLICDAFLLAKACLKITNMKIENMKLETLAKKYGFEDQFHRALIDSKACYHVIKNLLNSLPEKFEDLNIERNFKLFSMFDLNKKKFDESEKVQTLRVALERNENLNIIYKGGSKGRLPRPVRPIALLPLPQGYVLYALCLKDNQSKMFNLKKIEKVLKEEKK